MRREGVLTTKDAVTGLAAAYGMSPDLSAFLSTYAILFSGDPVAGKWSIGGPPPPTLTSLLFRPQGISNSHNNYEGDASLARGDAYINDGDAESLSISRFETAYRSTSSDDQYTLDSLARDYGYKAQLTIDTNQYAFFAPFSGLVAPAAYSFVGNFMSNHSTEEPSGYLDGEMFKQFFAVKGTYPNLVWDKHQERIPGKTYTNCPSAIVLTLNHRQLVPSPQQQSIYHRECLSGSRHPIHRISRPVQNRRQHGQDQLFRQRQLGFVDWQRVQQRQSSAGRQSAMFRWSSHPSGDP
jgi:hypothetical protein